MKYKAISITEQLELVTEWRKHRRRKRETWVGIGNHCISPERTNLQRKANSREWKKKRKQEVTRQRKCLSRLDNKLEKMWEGFRGLRFISATSTIALLLAYFIPL